MCPFGLVAAGLDASRSQKVPSSLFSRFSNLGVLHVTKKNMMEIMKEKLKQQKMRNRSRLLTGEGNLGTQWASAPWADSWGLGLAWGWGG